MSIRVMTALWDSPRIETPGDTLVLLALADFCNDEGFCYPGVERIAAKCRMDARSVRRILSRYRDLGALSVEYGTGRHNTNRYRLNVPWFVVAKADAVSGLDGKEDTGAEKGGHGCAERGTGMSGEPSLEPSPNHQGGDAPAREASPSEETPPSPEAAPSPDHPALRAYFEITGRRAVPIHFQVTITARVGDDPARLEAWRELLYVWKATTEPGHVGTPYNLGNVPRMLEALEEKAGRRRTDTTAPTSKPAGGMNMFQAMAEAEKRGVSLSEHYVELPSGYWARRPQAQA